MTVEGMTAGIRRVGRCYSGVLFKPPDATANPWFKILPRLGLATPCSIDLLMEDIRLLRIMDRELALKGSAPWGRLFERGLTLETFYGRGERTCIGVYFSHRIVQPKVTIVDGQRTAVLDMDQPEDPAFLRIIQRESDIYQQAKSIIYSLVPEGREVFFGITGIVTSGLEKLSDDLYSALLARIDNKYGLESLAAICVLQDAGMIEKPKSSPEGIMLTISSGVLEKEPGRAYPGGLRITSSPALN